MKMTIKEQVLRFLRDEEGQSTTEYILILAVVVMIASKFRKEIGDQISKVTTRVGNQISEQIQE